MNKIILELMSLNDDIDAIKEMACILINQSNSLVLSKDYDFAEDTFCMGIKYLKIYELLKSEDIEEETQSNEEKVLEEELV